MIVGNTKAIDNLTPGNKAAFLKASGEAGSALFGKYWDAGDERAAGPTPSSATTPSRPSHRPSSTSGGRYCRRPPTSGSRKPKAKGEDGQKLLDDLKQMIKAASS